MVLSSRLKTLIPAALLAAALALSVPAAPAMAKGQLPKLPAPYVSRALDAVVIPIDGAVRKAFRLKARDKGVLVLAVSPRGLAARNGIRPGDVLRSIRGYGIAKASDVDAIVYYWITRNLFDFVFDVGHGGVYALYSWPVTRADYIEVIDVTEITAWESWSVETYSFSYSEFYSEYASEITETYESSETLIEQEVTSESFIAEATAAATDANNDGTHDGLAAIENEDAAAGGDEGAGGSEAGAEENNGTEPDQADAGGAAEDQPADGGAASGDEPPDDGSSADDGSGQESGDTGSSEENSDGGGEEPATEE